MTAESDACRETVEFDSGWATTVTLTCDIRGRLHWLHHYRFGELALAGEPDVLWWATNPPASALGQS